MSREIDKKIQDHLDLTVPAAKKELNFIENLDWSKIPNLEKREKKYNVQNILNDRNINALVKLHSIAKEDLSHPEVKKAVKLFLRFYYVLQERYSYVDKRFDWTKFDQDDDNVEAKMEAEMVFQAEVLKNLTIYRERLRKINFGEEDAGLDIPIHGDKPVPIAMQYVIEQRYPEIREKINERLQDSK
jgi:hypothetical protein